MLASELVANICSQSVKYDLVRFHKLLASKCLLFTNEDIGYVPYKKVSMGNSLGDILKFYKEYNAEQQAREMIVCDALTFNVDRHMGNHGVLICNDTNEILGMAPVFDFNLAMLPYVMEDEFLDMGHKMLDYSPKIGEDFTRTAQAVVNSGLREMLYLDEDISIEKANELEEKLFDADIFAYTDQVLDNRSVYIYFYLRDYFDTAFVVSVDDKEHFIEIEMEGLRKSLSECDAELESKYQTFVKLYEQVKKGNIEF